MRPFNYEGFPGKPVEPVFDPPSCPAPRYGQPINLSAAPAELYEDPLAGDGEDPRVTYAWMTFGQRDGDGSLVDIVETELIAIGADDPLFPVVKELGGKPDDPRIERARQVFCDRALQCRGPVNGECWALGKSAVDHVLRETLL